MSPRWRLAAPLAALVTIHLATLIGGFLAPNSAIEQNRELAWAPPTRLRFVDAAGRFHPRPFVYPLKSDPAILDLYTEDRASPCPLRFLVRGDAYRLLGLFPTDLHFLGVDPPGKLYFLGTDGVGRDLFARTLVGGRTSLFAGLLAASLALTIGTLVGGVAGYFGGTTDAVLMRVVELFLALPWLYLLLAVRAFLPLTLPPVGAFTLLVAAVGFLGWARPARLIRSIVLAAHSLAFVTASKSFGASHQHLFFHLLFPETFSILRTQAAIIIPQFVLAEVTLSFLGLGMPEPAPSWGSLLAQLQRYHVLTGHPTMLLTTLPLLTVSLLYYSLMPRGVPLLSLGKPK